MSDVIVLAFGLAVAVALVAGRVSKQPSPFRQMSTKRRLVHAAAFVLLFAVALALWARLSMRSIPWVQLLALVVAGGAIYAVILLRER
jgi:hypothetical protein